MITHLRRRAFVCALFTLSYSFQGCEFSRNRRSVTLDFPGRPLEQSTERIAADFRFTPPKVRDLEFQQLSAGKVLVRARFAADPRLGDRVRLASDGENLVLQDDGKNGDEIAHDGVFSAATAFDFSERVAQQDQLLSELKKSKSPLSVAKFVGRTEVAVEKIDLEKLLSQRSAGIFSPLPFGAGGALVDASRSLLITHPSVVDDPARTYNPFTASGTPLGKWTFGYLMTQLANQMSTGVDPADLVFDWLQTWTTDQTLNGVRIPAREFMPTFLQSWPRQSNGKLDLVKSPIKLLAIVNRLDLSSNQAYGKGSGAEGRFIFGLKSGDGTEGWIGFYFIVEYEAPAHGCFALRSWAQQWLALQNFPLGSSSYNAALEAITDQLVTANAEPQQLNGSALNQIRTNEKVGHESWEMREFHLGGDHRLHPHTMPRTVDQLVFGAGQRSAILVDWINQHAPLIAQDNYSIPSLLVVPERFSPPKVIPLAAAFLPKFGGVWDNPGIINETVRHHFALNSCNGCHSNETGTQFAMVEPTGLGPEAQLSPFLLSGPPVQLSVPGNPVYSYNELLRRAQILSETATASCLEQIRLPVTLMSE